MSEIRSGAKAATMEEPSCDSVGQTVLWSYLLGAQDGQAWALLDNLSADDLRDVARAAILLLSDANAAIALSAVALDGMTERSLRFRARDAALACIKPYVERIEKRIGARDDGSNDTGSTP